MKIDNDFGKKMREACIKTCREMEKLREALSKLDIKRYPDKRKYHS